ncbi:hypothetical protein OSTOST_04230, partial [Ostertagia ostertagi]
MPDTPSDALWRIAAFAFIMLLSGRDRWWIVFIVYSIYRLTRTELFDRIRRTLRRDLSGIYLLVRVKLDINRRFKANRPIHEVFLEQVRKHPQKLACVEVETGRQITYDELNSLTNRYANYFDVSDGFLSYSCKVASRQVNSSSAILTCPHADKTRYAVNNLFAIIMNYRKWYIGDHSLGYKKGDVVALYMENCIDFFALWLGLSKIGVVSAFINSHLKLEPLAYSINVAKCRAIITRSTLLP